MNTRRSKTDNDIAFLNSAVVYNLALVNNTGAVACDIVFIFGHHTGMLGCLAAYKGTACLHTDVCNTLDDSGNLFGNIFADCNIVKEVEGLCTTADNVVDSHCNCVYTDSIMLVH